MEMFIFINLLLSKFNNNSTHKYVIKQFGLTLRSLEIPAHWKQINWVYER